MGTSADRRPQKGKGKGKGNSNEKPEGCTSVVVNGLGADTVEDALWTAFEDCGEISNVSIVMDRDTGASRGFAFVDFVDTSATEKAVAKSDTKIDGETIRVRY